MSGKSILRLLVVLLLLGGAIWYAWRSPLEQSREGLRTTLMVVAITGIYAFFTFEIMLQNGAMVKATNETAKVMERSLRFSFAPKITFTAHVTRDPLLSSRAGSTAIRTIEYENALKEYAGPGTQTEFVFLILRNVGRGPATSVEVQATCEVKDTTNPNGSFTLKRRASKRLLEPDQEIAMFIFMSKTPTPDDQVEFTSGNIENSDLYRDALKEAPQSESIDFEEVEKEKECSLSVTFRPQPKRTEGIRRFISFHER